jgi:5-(carboxyamino)imidazole ribonucleotide mutase
MPKVVIIMGSRGDLEHCGRIARTLAEFGVACEKRVASAHKVPLKALEIVRESEQDKTVFVTVAGRSNALSGFADAQTFRPVIACPPPGEAFGGADIYSSLRMPSGVCPLVVLDPENAALAAVKILALADDGLKDKIAKYQAKKRDELESADKEVRKNG